MSLLLLIGALLVGGGAYLIARGLRGQEQSTIAQERLLQFMVTRRVETAVTPFVASGKGAFSWLEPSGKDRSEMIQKLQEAGFASTHALQNFALIRLALSIGMTVIVYFWTKYYQHMESLSVIVSTVLTFIGLYVGAGQWLDRAANNRKNKIRKEFSFVLDLFVLTVEAGLSLDQAIRHVTRHAERAAPLTQAGLVQLVHEIDTGVTYDDALARWASRLGVDEAREMAAMFRQSLIHGAPLGNSLRTYSADLRERRMLEIREVAGKIAVRMTLIMVLCFLPALMILIGGPAFNAIMTGLSGSPDVPTGFPK